MSDLRSDRRTWTATEVLRVRPLRPYFAGIAADTFSDALWFVALGWLAQTAGDPFTASLIVFAGSVPSAAVMLGLATVAERLAAPRTVLVTLAVRIAVLAVVACLVPVGGTVAVIAVAAVVLGVLDGFHITSLETWPLVLSPSDEAQTPILAIERIVQRLAQAAAGVAGGWLLSEGGAASTVLVALAASAVAWVVLFRGHPPHEQPHDEDAAEDGQGAAARAVHLVWGHAVLKRSMAVHGLYNAATFGVALVGFAAVGRARGWDSATYGAMYALWAAGLLVGASVLLRWVGSTQHKVLLALLLVVLTGGVVAALGLTNSQPLAIVCAALLGLLGGPVGPALGGYLRMIARRSSNPGGLTAVQALLTVGVEPLGLLMVGGLLAILGISGGLIAVGAMIAVTALWALASSAVRTARS